jgi:hypothetical protein
MRFKKQKEIGGHSAGIYSLAFDGTFLYSCSADKYIARWDLLSGVQDKFAIQFDFPVYSVLLINDGKHLIAGLSSGHFHVFDLYERKEIKFYTQHQTAIFALAENPSKSQFYVSDSDGNFSVWNAVNHELLLLLPINCGKIRRITVSDDGALIALCCEDGLLRIFDSEFFNELYSFNAHNDGVTSAIFSLKHAEEIITGGKDGFVRKWNFKTGLMLKAVPAHNFVVYELVTMDHGRTLVSASRDKTIKVFDLENMTFLQRLDLKEGGHRHSVNCLIKFNETTFASASDDKRMIVWEE